MSKPVAMTPFELRKLYIETFPYCKYTLLDHTCLNATSPHSLVGRTLDFQNQGVMGTRPGWIHALCPQLCSPPLLLRFEKSFKNETILPLKLSLFEALFYIFLVSFNILYRYV